MVGKNFYIVLNIRTADGFENFGKFFLGHDKEIAYRIFAKLAGRRKVSDDGILHLDLVETRNDLPENIQVISCTLEEIAENCKIITKEIFKQFNLGEI